MMNGRKEFRKLRCKLTTGETLERGKTLAARIGEYNRKESVAKTAAEIAKGELKALRRDIDVLGEVVDTGAEYRDVEVVMSRDEKRFEMVITRVDTHEDIERRPMTETERQQPLFANDA